MVSVKNVSVSFGSFDLLKDISFLINDQDRIALAGRNGAGKSTLLKVIAGIQNPVSGSVDMPKDITVGYLPQQMNIDYTSTIWDETITAFSEIIELAGEIERCRNEISCRDDYDSTDYLKLCEALATNEERFGILGGTGYIAETELALKGLGFEREDFSRPARELSGGWRMRIQLARILLKKPDLLLLDEPINHLDIESIQWLEEFLGTYPGAVLLVSHDRAFLDNVTTRTIEISLGRIYDYRVPWSEYVKLRKERREQQVASFRNQQKMIADTEKFIERFRYKATKAVQVQSRIKHLARLERIEVDEEETGSLNIRFPAAPRSGTVVIKADNISKSFGNNSVLSKVSLTITRGEKIAFVGRNGEGKTTFSRILTGELDHTGTIKSGHNVKTGYYAQNQDELLDGSKSILETIDEVAKGEMRTKIRDLLGAFLFSGEEVDKKVKVLSGGERSRLALARLMLEPFNLLILDEPTNHLDIRSKEILKDALNKYDGTLIVVSHDRDFLDGLVTRVFEFRNRNIKEHLGGIYDFLRKKKMESLREIELKDKATEITEPAVISTSRKKYLERKEYERNLRKLRKRLEDSEKRIEMMEKELKEITEAFSGKNSHGPLPDEIYSNYEILKDKLNEEMVRWTSYSHDLELFINENTI